jgi:hypothetical protein
LSNIKWEKGSNSGNSGRDSVTSAFRKELFTDINPKPFGQKFEGQDLKKESRLRKDTEYLTKFNYDFLQTDPKFLEMIQ